MQTDQTPTEGIDPANQETECAFQDVPDTPDTVHLFSVSLLSKHGFHDGDQLDWLRSHRRGYSKHDVLIECVKRKMLPVLVQRVEICEVSCCHNPCRAETVDGKNVSGMWYNLTPELNPPLSPESVTVTGAEIIAIAEELRSDSANA